jgi:hypothetical protein
VYLLAYNVIRLIMAKAATLSDVLPRQLSFKHALQVWNACSSPMTDVWLAQSVDVLMLIAEQRVGQRSGRVEPRALKCRPPAYPLLNEPRAAARAKLGLRQRSRGLN